MTITREALETIRIQAENGYPFEICGLLVGNLVDDERQVREAWPIENAWESDPEEKARILAELPANSDNQSAEDWDAHGKGRRFMAPPNEVRRCMNLARELKLDVLGVYHTHPNHPAIPSGFDRDAAMPGWSYIIASVMDGKVAECRSWELEETGEQFFEENVQVLENSSMTRVEIPPGLAAFADGRQEFELSGSTVQEVLFALGEQLPELGAHLLRADGSLRSYVNAFVNDADIRTLAQLETPLSNGDTLTLVPSIAGG